MLDTFLGFALPPVGAAPPDLLDTTIASRETRREVEASTALSKRWGLITDLQPTDFLEALRAAHGRL